MPDVPTLERARAEIEFYLWVGLSRRKEPRTISSPSGRDAAKKAAANDDFKRAMNNIGQDVAYMDQPEFEAFWDTDATKRVEAAVHSIGKVQG